MLSSQELVQNIITALTNRLKNINDEKMYLDLVCALSTIPFLIQSKSVYVFPTTARVLTKLCSYIKKKIEKNNQRLANSLLFALHKWLACFPNVINDEKLRSLLLELLAFSKNFERIRDISAYIEEFITCNIGKKN
jgi:hypothetical protein